MSVVIVNYRAYGELDACLASLAATPLLETIVVDHASWPDQVSGLQARHPHVRFLPTDRNPGFGAGVNAGARLASSRHLLLLNPDTRVDPNAIPQMLDHLERHPEIGVVGARVIDPDGTVQRSARTFPSILAGLVGRTSLLTRLWPRNPWSRRHLVGTEAVTSPIIVDWVAGSCLMVRADAFRAIGGMDEAFFMYWEDADFCKRLADAGWLTAYVPSAAVTHLVGRSSRHASVRSIRAFHDSAFRYFARHGAGRLRYLSLPAAALVLYTLMTIKMTAARLSYLRRAARGLWREGSDT